MATHGPHEAVSLEQQIDVLQRQLAQAQKLTALGELVGTTTHEFNNVLMTVINYAKMGLRHKDEATRDKSFAKILAAGERAAKITNAVLGMARNRNESLAPTDLRGIIEESLVLLEREMRKYRISIETEFEEIPPAIAIGNQIQQVLLNFLINARQAMQDGGRIVIKLAHDKANDMVELVVRDTGTGIPADKLPHIFDPYFSTKSGPDETGKGGAGLGLSACRKIIEGHRGRLRVESTVGVGTAFTVKLPAYHKPAGPAPTLPASTNAAPTQTSPTSA